MLLQTAVRMCQPTLQTRAAGPGSTCAPREKARSALTGRKTDSVISEKQLDPLTESDGVCSRLTRVRGSLRRDPHLQALPFDGHPAALTKTKTQLLSLGKKPFHAAGAPRSAAGKLCFWCLEGEREREPASIEPGCWELTWMVIISFMVFPKRKSLHNMQETWCDREKAVGVWEGRRQDSSSP